MISLSTLCWTGHDLWQKYWRTNDLIKATISVCSHILEFMLLNIPNPK
jgi:hypothetical protein